MCSHVTSFFYHGTSHGLILTTFLFAVSFIPFVSPVPNITPRPELALFEWGMWLSIRELPLT